MLAVCYSGIHALAIYMQNFYKKNNNNKKKKHQTAVKAVSTLRANYNSNWELTFSCGKVWFFSSLSSASILVYGCNIDVTDWTYDKPQQRC